MQKGCSLINMYLTGVVNNQTYSVFFPVCFKESNCSQFVERSKLQRQHGQDSYCKEMILKNAVMGN